jgi:hypothetical protein
MNLTSVVVIRALKLDIFASNIICGNFICHFICKVQDNILEKLFESVRMLKLQLITI